MPLSNNCYSFIITLIDSRQVKLWGNSLREALSCTVQTNTIRSHHIVLASAFVQRAGCNYNCCLWTQEQSTNRDTIQLTKPRLCCAGGNLNERGLCLPEARSEDWGRGRHGAHRMVYFSADQSPPGCSLDTTTDVLDVTKRHNWGWPEFSFGLWMAPFKGSAEPHGAQDLGHKASLELLDIATIKRLK